MSSCSVESRINRWSYTDEWYYLEGERYQVYQTLTHRRYIILIDTTKFVLKREYLKKE
jgi:hypothetical protein